MNTIIVTNQGELDALPDSFDEETVIEIRSKEGWIKINKNWDSAHVEAWGSAHVEAWGNVSVKIFSQVELILKEYAVGIAIDSKPKLIDIDPTAHLINVPKVLYSKKSFLGIYKKNIQKDGRILLYKSVRDDGTDFYSGKIKYEGIVACPDWDPDCNRECGGGLHLSPTPELAQSHNKGKILRCLVHPDDFIVYPRNINKVRCRRVEAMPD